MNERILESMEPPKFDGSLDPVDSFMKALHEMAQRFGKRLPEDTELLNFENMSERVRKAYHIAREAHRGQKDKAGEAYILHPMKVASALFEPDDSAIIVALLHDVIEDTDVTLSDLVIEGVINEHEEEALRRLTHDDANAYGRYIAHVQEIPLAAKVKISDLMHNADLRRIPNPKEKDFARTWKYIQSLRILLGELKLSPKEMETMLK